MDLPQYDCQCYKNWKINTSKITSGQAYTTILGYGSVLAEPTEVD